MNRTIEKKEDMAIMTLTNSIGLMSYMTLYDVFGFSKKEIRKYYDAVQQLKKDWSNEIMTTEQMIKYCKSEKIDIDDFIKKIPTRAKVRLMGQKNTVPSALKYVDAGFRAIVLMSVIELKEIFSFSNGQIMEYLRKIEYYIDSYTKKQPKCNKMYLTDAIILDIFRQELKIDLNTGENVA